MCSRYKKYLQAFCYKGLIEHKNFVLTLCSMVSFFVLTKQTFSDFVLNTLYFVLNTLYFVLNFPFLYSMKFNKSLFFNNLYKFKYFEYNEYNKKQIYFKFVFLFGYKLYIKKAFHTVLYKMPFKRFGVLFAVFFQVVNHVTKRGRI